MQFEGAHARGDLRYLDPDGTRLASVGNDGTVRIWDASTCQEINAFVGHVGPVYSVAWHPDGKRLASGGLLDLKIWDPITGKEAIDIKFIGKAVNSVAWSPDGLRLAATNSATAITIYDAAKGYRFAGKAAAPAAK